jgi:creatinine amidohydrolase
MSWIEVEQRLKIDKRVVIPLGATEEHGFLSLLTDTLFVNYVTNAACSHTNVLRSPTVPFGCSAFAINFPGTISLRTLTLTYLLEDIVDSLYRQGFRRIVFVTGHGGNEVITGVLSELQIDRQFLNIYYRSAWAGMQDRIRELSEARGLGRTEHASWHEVFPFTRVGEVPDGDKTFLDSADTPLFPLNPRTARTYLGDGIVSGAYNLHDDSIMDELLRLCIVDLTQFLQSLPMTSASD